MNGRLLKQLMKEQKMRPEELAIRLGCTAQTIYLWCSEKVAPRHATIVALASIMGCNESDLVNDSVALGSQPGAKKATA